MNQNLVCLTGDALATQNLFFDIREKEAKGRHRPSIKHSNVVKANRANSPIVSTQFLFKKKQVSLFPCKDILLRRSVPHFPPNFRDSGSLLNSETQRSALYQMYPLLLLLDKKMIKKHLLPPSGNRTQTVSQQKTTVSRTQAGQVEGT